MSQAVARRFWPFSCRYGWMETTLPPVRSADRLGLELQLVPRTDREDAVQEAWLAFLSGDDPARAVNTFGRRERRLRRLTVGDIVPELD